MFRLIRTFLYLVYFLFSRYFLMKKYHKIAQRENPADNEMLHAPVKHATKRVVDISGSDVKVIGEENIPDGPVVFIGNHDSDFDIAIMLGYVKKPFGFVSKVETKKLPLVPTWMEIIGCAFLDRKDRREGIRTLKLAIEKVKKGYSQVIYPEGTRNRGGEVLEFKPGSLRLAKDGLAPIVPTVITGTADIFENNNYRIRPGKVVLKFLPAISNEELQKKDTVEFAKELQQLISEERAKILANNS